MDALVHAGFRVRGFDRSPAAVSTFEGWMGERHPGSRERWSAVSDSESFADARLIVIAVRALPLPDGSIDVEPVESAASILRANSSGPRLVMLEATVPCGTTRCFAAALDPSPVLFVAHSPERLSVGHDREVLRRVPHLVGGMDQPASRLGALFLRTICDEVVQLSSPEASELSKLLENAFLTTGIALSNEVTRLAHAMGIAAEEVCAAAATKPFGYYPFFPGPGMGGHCLGNDLAILLSSGRRVGLGMPLTSAVAETAVQGPGMVVRRLQELWKGRGRDLGGSRVLLVGVGFKPGTNDTTGSPAGEIARLLRQSGADVWYLDSLVPGFAVDGQPLPRIEASELVRPAWNAAIVVAGDPKAPLERLVACSDLVFDARGRSPELRPEGVVTL